MPFRNRLVSATFQLTIGNTVVRLLAIVTMPILTRFLSPAAYGGAAMVNTIIAFVSVIALSGLDISYARAYHSKLGPSGTDVEVFVWRYAFAAGLLAGLLTAATWWFFIAAAVKMPQYLAFLLGIGIFFLVINAMTLMYARLNNRYRMMSVANVVSALASAAIGIGVAIWVRQDEIPLILSLLATYIIPLLIIGFPAGKIIKTSQTMSVVERLSILKIGIAGIATGSLYWVISSLDRWFLAYYDNIASVGIYSTGYGIAITGMVFNVAITSAWLPEASRLFENNNEKAQIELGHVAEQFIVILALVWLAVTAAGGDVVRLLTAPMFHDGAAVVPYIAGAVFFHGVLHIANAGMILKNKLHQTLWWWLGSAILCVALNMLFIPIMGRLGAALTQTCSFAFVALGIFYSSQKIFTLKVRATRLYILFPSIIMIGALMNPRWSSTPLLSLAIKLPVGMIIAWLTLSFFRIAPKNIFTSQP